MRPFWARGRKDRGRWHPGRQNMKLGRSFEQSNTSDLLELRSLREPVLGRGESPESKKRPVALQASLTVRLESLQKPQGRLRTNACYKEPVRKKKILTFHRGFTSQKITLILGGGGDD